MKTLEEIVAEQGYNINALEKIQRRFDVLNPHPKKKLLNDDLPPAFELHGKRYDLAKDCFRDYNKSPAGEPTPEGVRYELLKKTLFNAVTNYYLEKSFVKQKNSFFSRAVNNDHGELGMNRAIQYIKELQSIEHHNLKQDDATMALLNFAVNRLTTGKKHYGPTSFKANLVRCLAALFESDAKDIYKHQQELLDSNFCKGISFQDIDSMQIILMEKYGALNAPAENNLAKMGKKEEEIHNNKP